MANGITPITPQFSTPYLTLDEYKNAPTALDYGNLVQGGNQAAQDAELTNAITRASSAIDVYCNQVLAATTDTEQQRVRVSTDGLLKIHPKYFPVVALTALSFGSYPGQLQSVPDCSLAWFEEQEIIFPYSASSLTYSSQGPLSFGFPVSNKVPVFVNYTYVNGYANTIIAANVSAAATSITVASGAGIVAGQMLTVYDGASTERVTVASTYTFGSTTVPLAAPAAYAHSTGVAVSALPAAIKQAAILITSANLKIRGDASLTLGVTNRPGEELAGSQKLGSDVAYAKELLNPFRRIR